MLQYLDEAHAMETALVTNLGAHASLTTGKLKTRLEQHRRETQDQVKRLDERRKELGGDDGRGVVAGGIGLIRDAIGQAIVLTKGPIDALRQPSAERALKNTRDDIASEALEIATYVALEAAAKAAGDTTTARLAAEIRKEEEQMLSDLRDLLPELAASALAERTQVSAAAAKAAVAKGSSTSSSRSTSSTSRSTSRTSSTRKSSSSSTTRKPRSTSSSSTKSSSSSSARKTPAKAASSRSTSSRTTKSGSSSTRSKSGGTTKRGSSASKSSGTSKS